MSDVMAEAEAQVEGMKKKFSLQDVLTNKVTYPTDTVDVFLDGESAYRVIILMDEVNYLLGQAAAIEADAGGIVGSPEADALKEQAEEKKTELQSVMDKARKSLIVFTLRGIPSKVWRVLDEKARRKFPVDTSKSEEDQREDNIKRNEWVNIALVKDAIIKAEDADGNVLDSTTFTFDAVEDLYDNIYESEWAKIVEMKDKLTFANAMFDEVTTGDADFTPTSSPAKEM